jgi:hypothetical protein
MNWYAIIIYGLSAAIVSIGAVAGAMAWVYR